MAPIVFVNDTATALYISRPVATAIFAVIGAAFARNLTHHRWPATLILGGLGFALFTAAYAARW